MKMSIVSFAVVLAACASSAPQAPTTTVTPQPAVQTPAPVAFNPAGNYEFSTTVNGQPVTGTMTIIASGTGGYAGRILTTIMPEIPVSGVSVDGNKMTVKGSLPDGELILNLTFTGLNFTGNWQVGADTGDFSGKKLP